MAGINKFRHDVFVCHSWRNKLWVRQFAAQLEALKLKLFFDERSIKAGAEISDEIRKALPASRTLVFLISPASATSFWAHMEVAGALLKTPALKGVCLIPVVLEKTDTSQFPAPFHNKKHIDLTDPTTRNANYKQLLKTLLQNAGRKVPNHLPPPPPFRLNKSFDPTPGGHVLAIGAHWDDILLGCFGTLLKLKLIFGYRVEILVICTHYEHGYFEESNNDLNERARTIYAQIGEKFDIESNCGRTTLGNTINIADREFARDYRSLDQFLAERAKDHENCNLILTPPIDDRHEDHAITGKLTVSHFRKSHQTVLEYEIKPHSDRVFAPNIFVGLAEQVEIRNTNHKSNGRDLMTIADLKVETLTQLVLENAKTKVDGANLHFGEEVLRARMRINALDFGGNKEIQYGEAFRGTIHL